MDEIRVRWSEYKGHRYLDIRVYTEIEGNADMVPTKKEVYSSNFIKEGRAIIAGGGLPRNDG